MVTDLAWQHQRQQRQGIAIFPAGFPVAGQLVLDQLESQEALRLAIISRNEEQLMKAIEEALVSTDVLWIRSWVNIHAYPCHV